MWLQNVLVTVSLLMYGASGEDGCTAFNFEDGFQDSFSETTGSMCQIFRTPWIEGSYADVGVEPPNDLSSRFVSPQGTMSCVGSLDFEVSANGIIEFTVYMSGDSTNDQISLMVHQKATSAGGMDSILATIIASPANPDFVPGWNIYRATILGTGDFQGYVSMMGVASEGSLVLVDSFRYLPPDAEEDACVLYNAGTPAPEEDETCTTYNFENDFELHFFNDNYLCKGFLPWQVNNYTSIGIDSPDPRSTIFMTPVDGLSCINSFVFHMDPSGVVEANVYMDPVQVLDHIVILAHRVTGREYDTTAGFKMYHPENQVFVAGWNLIRFSIVELTSFDGYLIFMGGVEPGSTVLVDSFRYIPPGVSSDAPSCRIY